MNRLKFLAGLCLTACLATVPAFAQTDTKAKEPPKPALGPSAAVLEGWNDIGRKLIAIAEDLPEDKYDFKPNPDSRTFVQQLLHVSASMYYFTDPVLGQKVRYSDDPIVSTDVIGNSYSCIYDSELTMARGNEVKVFGWYDNEWGYSCRLVDLVGRLL